MAVLLKFALEFHAAHCCRWASIIGGILPSGMTPAATIMKPAPANGTSRQESGRKRNLQMFTAYGVGRIQLFDAFGLAFVTASLLFSFTTDDQNFEICPHLSDKSVRSTRACKIEVRCSSLNNSRLSWSEPGTPDARRPRPAPAWD